MSNFKLLIKTIYKVNLIKKLIRPLIRLYRNRNKDSKNSVKRMLSKYYNDSEITVLNELGYFQQQIFLINIKGKKNSFNCYLKLFKGHLSWWSGNSDNIFEREIDAIKFLKYSNCSTQNIITTGVFNDAPWMLTENIEGILLTNKPKINPEKLAAFISNMQNANIHKIKLGHLLTLDKTYIENTISKIAKLIKMDYSFIKELSTIINTFSKTSDLVFLHGDLHLGNIILKPDGELAVLDFEESGIGYRQFDIGEIGRSIIENYGQEFYELFLNAYYKISGCKFKKNFLEESCDFTDITRKTVGIFMLNKGFRHKLPYSAKLMIGNEKQTRIELNQILERRHNNN